MRRKTIVHAGRVGAAVAIFTAALLGIVDMGTASADKTSYNCTLSERAGLGFHDLAEMNKACGNDGGSERKTRK